MKTLYLVRHAKASKEPKYYEDQTRPLTPQGEHDIKQVAGMLHRFEVAPDLILCSTALRTRQTLEGLTAMGMPSATIAMQPELYLASASRLFDIVCQQPDTCDSVMIIGHNQGLHQLAIALTGTGDISSLQMLSHQFPTLACVGITFDAHSWSELSLAAGDLDFYCAPNQDGSSMPALSAGFAG